MLLCFIHALDDVRLQLLHVWELPEMFCMLGGFFVMKSAPIEAR